MSLIKIVDRNRIFSLLGIEANLLKTYSPLDSDTSINDMNICIIINNAW